MQKKKRDGKIHGTTAKAANLPAKAGTPKTAQRREGYIRNIIPKTISRTRTDIATWRSALRSADSVDNPRRAKLMNLYEDIMLDAHLTSQIELRHQTVLSTPFDIKVNQEVDDEATAALNAASWVTALNTHILNSAMYGHTLVELTTTDSGTEPVAVTLLPRQNVIPEKGLLLLREDDSKGIKYREVREFGTWLLEFGKEHDYGLLNKAVPHVLFMRFAQSCWSELCEIYGIPPRFIKTDTQDPAMLDRAEAMLRDMGAAAYFIIDRTEEFQFAKGADTNGDVYSNLISVCKEAVSLLMNGVVMGQDTVNGNRSKEESSIRLFEKIVLALRKMVAGYWNSTVIPALVRIGILKPGSTFAWQQEEDIEKLWSMVVQLLQFKDVPNEWIKEKFGSDCTDKAFTVPGQLSTTLSAQPREVDFFATAP